MTRRVFLLVLALLPGSVFAELLLSESFDKGLSGWTVKQANGSHTITGDTLSYQSLLSSGSCLRMQPDQEDISGIYSKPIGTTISSGPLWLSFLMNAEKVEIPHAFVSLGTNAAVGKMWGTKFSIHNKSSSLPVTEGKTHRILVRFDLRDGKDDVWLWVDPPLRAEPDPSTALLHENKHDIVEIEELAISIRGKGSAAYTFDEFRIGTSWAEVNDIQLGDFLAQGSVSSKKTGGPFYAKFQFPAPVQELSEKNFRVSNGRITKILGNDRSRLILIEPAKAGPVKITLGRGLAKGIYGGVNKELTSISVDYDPSIQSKPLINYEITNDYAKKLTGNPKSSLWKGKRVMLVMDPNTGPADVNLDAMGRFIDIMDQAYTFLETTTGFSPKSTTPLVSIEITSNPDGADALDSQAGIAIPRNLLDDFLSSKNGQISPIIFSKLAQNFWNPELDYRIDYYTTPGRQHGWWSKAFSHTLTALIAKEFEIELSGTNEKFESALTTQLTTYADGTNYTWHNTFSSSTLPWSKTKTPDQVMAGLLLKLASENGDALFIQKLLSEISKLEIIKSRSHRVPARNNLFLACTRAAGKDLSTYFTKTLKWPLTPATLKEARGE